MRKYFLALGMILLALPAMAQQSLALGLAAGPSTGSYLRLGKDIAAVAATQGVKVDVKETAGSIENIKRIASDEGVALGIVQSDVLAFLRRSENEHSRRIAEHLYVIFPLYQEEVHLLARGGISSLHELKGKRVVVGSEGSGTMLTAVNVMTIMRTQPAAMLKLNASEGLLALLKSEADAMFLVGGKPLPVLKNLEALRTADGGVHAGLLKDLHFLPLNYPSLLKEYRLGMLTSQDYSLAKAPVATVAVTAILIDYDFWPAGKPHYKEKCDALAKLADAIRDNLDYLRSSGHPKWREVDLTAKVGFWKQDRCAWRAELSPAAAQELQKDLLSTVQKVQGRKP